MIIDHDACLAGPPRPCGTPTDDLPARRSGDEMFVLAPVWVVIGRIVERMGRL